MASEQPTLHFLRFLKRQRAYKNAATALDIRVFEETASLLKASSTSESFFGSIRDARDLKLSSARLFGGLERMQKPRIGLEHS